MRINNAAASALALILAACGGGSAEHGETGEHGGEHAEAAEGHAPSLGPLEAHAAEHGPAAPHGAAAGGDANHWDYMHQAAWAQVAGACGQGQEQSPVNLSSAAPMVEMPDLAAHYLAANGNFVNNGHTLQFNPAQSAATLMIGQQAYGFAQFHFHSPAEHTLDRRAYPAELHFVHRNSQGQLAVVGVFIEEGLENQALGALLASIPNGQGEEMATHITADLAALLPPDRAYFAYAGSLTTPPCSEGVRWNVLRTPIQASAAQIAALREALGSSSRHVQPLNQRTVVLGS
jgi:carbonic anhydrase